MHFLFKWFCRKDVLMFNKKVKKNTTILIQFTLNCDKFISFLKLNWLTLYIKEQKSDNNNFLTQFNSVEINDLWEGRMAVDIFGRYWSPWKEECCLGLHQKCSNFKDKASGCIKLNKLHYRSILPKYMTYAYSVVVYLTKDFACCISLISRQLVFKL